MPTGLILFAHGAREARWAGPFERLRDRVAHAAGGTKVVLAYLEMMAPDLDSAAATLAAAGCRSMLVIPVFLGQGSHVRRDLPLLLRNAAARHPECQFRLAEAAGDDDVVLDAIAAYCVRQLAA